MLILKQRWTSFQMGLRLENNNDPRYIRYDERIKYNPIFC